MLIVCPNCATSYDVEVASLRPNGRKVRCVRCRTIWHAELPHADKLVAAAEALAPGRPAETAAPTSAELSPAVPPVGMSNTAAALPPTAAGTDMPAEDPVGEAAYAAPADGDAADPAESADATATEFPEVESPPTVPVDLDSDEPSFPDDAAHDAAGAVDPLADIESVAARRITRRSQRRQWARWPLTRLLSGILALVIIDAVVVGWRADLVRVLPQTASFYAAIGLPVNLRGLTFDGVATATEQNEGVPILVVEGGIVNNTHKTADVPHLRFAVRNAAHQEIYSWTAPPPRPTLPPGEAIAFRTRLASPPPDVHDVLVRFLNRYDIMNGSR